jgi:hypothetical protein
VVEYSDPLRVYSVIAIENYRVYKTVDPWCPWVSGSQETHHWETLHMLRVLSVQYCTVCWFILQCCPTSTKATLPSNKSQIVTLSLKSSTFTFPLPFGSGYSQNEGQSLWLCVVKTWLTITQEWLRAPPHLQVV